MNTDRLKQILNITFVVLLCLPFLQKAIRFLPEPFLAGVENRAVKTRLSPVSWFTGKYARDFEKRLGIKIGFRGYLVKLSNQIDYSLFGKIAGRRGTQMVIGRNQWLYENAYVDYYIKNPRLPAEALTQYAAGIKSVQDALDARGITFVLVISPSKVEIYPEYLPDNVRTRMEGERHATIRQALLPLLDKQSVRYVDAHALFKDIKATSDVLFPPQGTHWNYYGSLLVCREVAKKINAGSALNLPLPEITSVTHRPALGSDNDLELLLNLFWFDKWKSPPVPYPEITVEALPLEERPDFLVVGDSFAFTVVDSIRYAGLGRRVDLLYYNKRLYSYPGETTTAFAADHTSAEVGPVSELPPGWENRLNEAEVVILEINEILLNKKAWGFIEDSLCRLKPAVAMTPDP